MTNKHAAAGSTGLSRRDLLKRGAVVGAAAAWTIPIVQVVSMTPAHADSPSAPNVPPNKPPHTPPNDRPTEPDRQTSTPTHSTATGQPNPHDSKRADAPAAVPAGALANTGGAVPVGPAVGIGAAALALGAGALTAAQLIKTRTPAPASHATRTPGPPAGPDH